MTAPVIIAERCHYCSKQRSPADIMRIVGTINMCRYCYAHHQECMKALSTAAPPKTCHECTRDFKELPETVGNSGDVEMTLVAKDGVYQLLCATCAREYTLKRSDLYNVGQFGKDTFK
jgi:hypothetical protein